MIIDGNHIIADEGKYLRRKSTQEVYGTEIHLGYSYYIGGVLQDPPHLDTPEDFEEVEGGRYISLIDANVWSPAEYPAGWERQ